MRLAVGAWAPPLLATLLLGTLALRPQATPGLPLTRQALTCTAPPTFRVGYESGEGALRLDGGQYRFQGVSWLEGDLCGPGTLLITADGEVAEQEAPVLQISLGRRVLLREPFAERRTVRVEVPSAGRLTLAYLNDLYRSEARVATLEGLRFEGSCEALDIAVPPETGGTWDPVRKTVSLVAAVPMTVVPCGAGELRLRTVGQAAGGAFPVLEFRQGKEVQRVATSGQRQQVRLRVVGSPLKITLVNPLFQELADRNLTVHQLEFRPDSPSPP
ncbi:hypothetical protein QOL99_02380 [Deinococcus sp. MIMF12]|uniref:Uncharacterized protein n=1 Tax=Deinococcus rhizophilus TaxID=3049544 RepID=A0ABT7JD57_9DEIO|nr:hypothetical protein [Deinococcus rhizophilus]MDL2342991.1 hypothetical protein [Deinococcus rhizophilus]